MSSVKIFPLMCAALTAWLALPTYAVALPKAISTERFLGLQTLRIWSGSAPDAKGDTPADIPSLTLFTPQIGRSNGTAVIVAPGGAYLFLASNLEGRQVADWFTARGVNAFVLNYRLGKRYPFPAALVDAQRAIRFVRANSTRFGISPDRVGIIGFSAGGHLAAMTATNFTAPNKDAPDYIDRVSDRPDFVMLAYPAIGFMEPGADGKSQYCDFTKIPDCNKQDFEKYTPDKLVRPDSPPVFLFHTSADTTISPQNSLRFYQALHKLNVPVELHVFETGKHGSGLGSGDPNLDVWPSLLESWLRQRGLLNPHPPFTYLPTSSQKRLSLDSAISTVLEHAGARTLIEKVLGNKFSLEASGPWASMPIKDILSGDLTITDEQILNLDRALRSLPEE